LVKTHRKITACTASQKAGFCAGPWSLLTPRASQLIPGRAISLEKKVVVCVALSPSCL